MPMIAIIALVCATLFTGAAGYITLVEHPARLELADAPLLVQWKPSYDRTLPIQSGLAVAGGVAGIGAWYLSGNLFWGLGSLSLLANWPFTLFAIMPANRLLKAIRTDEGGRRAERCWCHGESCTMSGVCWARRRWWFSRWRSPRSPDAPHSRYSIVSGKGGAALCRLSPPAFP